MKNTGMISRKNGKICAATTKRRIAARPRNRYLASANPASTLVRSCRAVMAEVTSRELASHVPIGSSENTRARFSHCGMAGQ